MLMNVKVTEKNISPTLRKQKSDKVLSVISRIFQTHIHKLLAILSRSDYQCILSMKSNACI